MNRATMVTGGGYELPNNCYAEVHVPRRWGAHEASTNPVAHRHCSSNTDPILSDEEQRVVELLELQQRIYGGGGNDCQRFLLAAGTSSVEASTTGGTAGGAVAAHVQHSAREEDPDPPFTAEVPIPKLLDALWCTRYRPLVIQQLELRRQRAAKVAAHKARKRAPSPSMTAVSQHTQQLLLASGAVSPTMSVLGGGGGAGASATSFSATAGRSSPMAMPLWIPAALGGPAVSSTAPAAGGGGGGLAAANSITSPLADNLSFAASNTSFGEGGLGSSTTSTTFLRQLLIPADDLVPKQFPLTSLRDALRGATNASLRSLMPTAENIAALYDVEGESVLPNSVRPEASAASYFGRESVCRCVLDLIPLCPNIQSVSIAYHHAPPETLKALAAILEGQHPSLSTVDLRGNVLEIPVARALARALRSNPRLTSVAFDKGNYLLPSTEKSLKQLVQDNAAKMRAVSAMRNEWTQTTLLPHALPEDLLEYLAESK